MQADLDLLSQPECRDAEILSKDGAKSLHTSLFVRPLIMATDGVTETGVFMTRLKTLCTHPNPTLRQFALSTLYRHMAQRAFFIDQCKQVTILVQPEAVTVYHETHASNLELIAMYYGLSVRGEREVARAVQMIEAMSDLVMISAEQSRPETPISNAPTTPVGQVMSVAERQRLNHQEIMRAIGVHKTILRILQMPLKRVSVKGQLDQADDSVRCKLFNTCYIFLRHFCQDQRTMSYFCQPHRYHNNLS